jgi:hypothetical protein
VFLLRAPRHRKAPKVSSPYPGARRSRLHKLVSGTKWLGKTALTAAVGVLVGAFLAFSWTHFTSPTSLDEALDALRAEARDSDMKLTILGENIRLRSGSARATVALLSPDLGVYEEGATREHLRRSDEIRIYETAADETRLVFSFRPRAPRGSGGFADLGFVFRMQGIFQHPAKQFATIWGYFGSGYINHFWPIPVLIEWDPEAAEYSVDSPVLRAAMPSVAPRTFAASAQKAYGTRAGLRDERSGVGITGHRVEGFRVIPDRGRGEGIIAAYTVEQGPHFEGPQRMAVAGWSMTREGPYRYASPCLADGEKVPTFRVRRGEQFMREAEFAWSKHSPNCP